MKHETLQLDLRAFACPFPIIKLKQVLAKQTSEAFCIELTVGDKGALKDIPAFCQLNGLNCAVRSGQGESEWVFLINP